MKMYQEALQKRGLDVDRFSDIQEAGIIGNVAGMVLFGPLWWAAFRAVTAALDDCMRKCGTFNISQKRDACIAKCREKAQAKRTGLIKREAGKCSQAKDPAKCRERASVMLSKEHALKKTS